MTAVYRDVFVEHVDAVSTVTINRPHRRNAVDVRALEALALLLDESTSREQTRVVVLRGEGGAFCAGADLPDEIADAAPTGRLDHGFTLTLVSRIVTTITTARLPVLAVADGPAAGVGASFAFACDVVLASEPSFFLLPFAGIALVPDGGATHTVAASIGRARALRLAMLECIPAREALDMGLIAKTCARENVEEQAQELIEHLASGPTRALAETKRLINERTLPGLSSALEAEAQAQIPALDSWEHREGVRAFRERRPAHFTHTEQQRSTS